MKTGAKGKSSLENQVADGYAAFCKRRGLPVPGKWKAKLMKAKRQRRDDGKLTNPAAE